MHWGIVMTQPDGFDLETVFEAARAAPPQMSDALSMRIIADAEKLQPARPLWQRLMNAIGGPAALGGLVTATIVGFWFGVSPPDSVLDPITLLGGVDQATDEDIVALLSDGWYSDEG